MIAVAGWLAGEGCPPGSRSRVGWRLSRNLDTNLVLSRFASCQWRDMYLTYPGNIKIQSNINQWQVIFPSLCTRGRPWRERSGLVSRGKREQKAVWRPWPHLAYLQMWQPPRSTSRVPGIHQKGGKREMEGERETGQERNTTDESKLLLGRILLSSCSLREQALGEVGSALAFPTVGFFVFSLSLWKKIC